MHKKVHLSEVCPHRKRPRKPRALPLYTELAMHEANFAAKLLPPALWINDFGFLKSIYRRCTGQGLAKLLRHLRSNGAFTLVGLQPVPILLAARIYCRPKPEPSGSEKHNAIASSSSGLGMPRARISFLSCSQEAICHWLSLDHRTNHDAAIIHTIKADHAFHNWKHLETLGNTWKHLERSSCWLFALPFWILSGNSVFSQFARKFSRR